MSSITSLGQGLLRLRLVGDQSWGLSQARQRLLMLHHPSMRLGYQRTRWLCPGFSTPWNVTWPNSSESSPDLWTAICDMYGNQNNSVRVFQIYRDIANLCQDGKSSVNVLSSLKNLWNELDIYRPHTINAAILRKRKEEDQIFQLLACLGSEYEI